MREDDLCDLLRFDKKVLRLAIAVLNHSLQFTLLIWQVEAGNLEDRQIPASEVEN